MTFMGGLLDSLERLIAEHGSAAALREHLALVKAKLADQEAEQRRLEAKDADLESRLFQAEHRAREAERQLAALSQAQDRSPFRCDKCGGANLIRSGNRPSPIWGVMGIKEALFRCADCGHVSAFELPPGP